MSPKEIKKIDKQTALKLVVTNKIALDPEQPVPIELNGNLSRYRGNQRYIPFIGSDDTFANTLLGARVTSTSQHSCISSIAQSLIGKGIRVKDTETPNQELFDWFKNVNKNKQTFDEFLISVIDGERTFGNQFIEIVKGEVKGKKFMKVYPKSFLKCRLKVPEDESLDLQEVIISNNFGLSTGFRYSNKDTIVPIWSNNILDQSVVWKKDEKGYLHTMLHFKNEVSAVEYYGLPASIAGLRYQLLEAKAAQFNIDNFDNNMVLGGILILKSGMSQAEAQKTAKEIFLTHIGEGKTGRIAVVASEDGMDGVDFKPFTTYREASYNESDKRWEEKIIAANEWDSVLAGINRSSTFGNGSQYIRSIWDVKDAVLLNPLRNKLLSKVVYPIVSIWAEHFNNSEVKGYEFSMQTNMPFSFMGDLDPNTFFKLKEARAKAGLPPDEVNGEKYLSEMRPKNTSNNNIQTNPGSNTSTSNGTGQNQ